MSELFTPEALTALLQVIMIDLVLAGDNAIVIGLAAAGLPKDQRAKAILPVQGDRAPWKLYQNYPLDLAALKYGKLDDGVMRFAGRIARQPPSPTFSEAPA